MIFQWLSFARVTQKLNTEPESKVNLAFVNWKSFISSINWCSFVFKYLLQTMFLFICMTWNRICVCVFLFPSVPTDTISFLSSGNQIVLEQRAYLITKCETHSWSAFFTGRKLICIYWEWNSINREIKSNIHDSCIWYLCGLNKGPHPQKNGCDTLGFGI